MVSSRKILLTTSRNPTPRIRTLCNDLARVLPNVVRISRGKMNTDEVAERALEHDAERVVIIDRWHGGPGEIKVFRINKSGLVSTSPIIRIAGIKLQREFAVSKVKPARSIVSLAPNNSEKVSSLAEIFSKLFGLPVLSMGEAVKAGSTLMAISHEMGNKVAITFMVEHKHEVGPRIVVSTVEW